MLTADKSIDPRLLECAKKAFLNKPYTNVSLRDICADAGVTTGALYKRYAGKEELFDVLVSPAIEALSVFSDDTESLSYNQLEGNAGQTAWEMPTGAQKKIMEMLYAHKDEFRLLLSHSDGTKYAGFLHDFVSDVTKRTMKFLRKAKKNGVTKSNITEEEMHMLLTAYWSTLFEPMLHDLPKKIAMKHCEYVEKLFDWEKVLG